jgi:hypothetical protein
VFAALTDGGQTDYRIFTSTGHLLDHGRDIRQLLAVFETRTTSREHRDATTVFHLETTGEPAVDWFRFVPSRSDVSDPRNVTFRLLVDEGGIVHRYRLTYTVTVEGRDLRYERIVHLSVIGTTSVRLPTWLDNVTTARSAGSIDTDS